MFTLSEIAKLVKENPENNWITNTEWSKEYTSSIVYRMIISEEIRYGVKYPVSWVEMYSITGEQMKKMYNEVILHPLDLLDATWVFVPDPRPKVGL